jgi:hypothetical protein
MFRTKMVAVALSASGALVLAGVVGGAVPASAANPNQSATANVSVDFNCSYTLVVNWSGFRTSEVDATLAQNGISRTLTPQTGFSGRSGSATFNDQGSFFGSFAGAASATVTLKAGNGHVLTTLNPRSQNAAFCNP